MMDYNRGTGDLKGWLVSEPVFDILHQGKYEAILSQGNGYMGVRSATEESYVGQVRNCFVAGTFNRFDENEVTELPNAADVTALDIYIDNELFSLEKGRVSNYHRTLNLKTGELERTFEWTNPAGKSFRFEFRRIVSFSDLHTMASKITIKTMDREAAIKIASGINGQLTNSGAQHFQEGEKRIFGNRFVQMVQKTTQSEIDFVHNTVHKVAYQHGQVLTRFAMDRRKVFMIYELGARSGTDISIEKISNIFTSRDKTTGHLSLEGMKEKSLEHLQQQDNAGYEILMEESKKAWAAHWARMAVSIESENPFDQLAIRFAQYHLLVMAPRHDSRYGIGAKGLSGEGYKGHSFWDSEIFILPFFTFSLPEIARSLLEYRYHSLKGARKKAKDNGYKGAMYPWESAWLDDGEVTPAWGEADIVTGKAQKILTGHIEIHITADIAYAVWQYYMVTGDEAFMKRSGYEILFDTGIFWGSRLDLNPDDGTYHINGVIGPDEYKEHINNDAYTNHMAHWCIDNAIHYYHRLKEHDPGTFSRLNKQLHLDTEIEILKNKLDRIYLPEPNGEGIIPQNDTYLQKPSIDLGKYMRQKQAGTIFKDYNIDQINEIQVTKQASVVMLVYLLEHKFNHEIRQANFHYYEPKTLHDSSLSLSSHAILAADIDDLEGAYDLFRKASEIDLGPNMKSSDKGVHAASLGGIWQIIVCGFGGLRMVGGKLRINPKLPPQVKSIRYPVNWKGNPLEVMVSKGSLVIENKGERPVHLTVSNKEYTVEKKLAVKF
ncbi:MAG: trehalase [Bacteroides sp. SM23_62]|nr:MAG: trehalase [Bacteroides sp. SM23_62]